MVETVIIYKLPQLSREEIQNMLQVSDIRETRVYQDAREEGMQEERQRSIKAMAAAKIPPDDIARMLGLSVELVREVLSRLQP